MNILARIFFILSLFSFVSSNTQAQTHQTRSTEWFEDARYGMFIHWGLYSAAEGMWKGEKLRYLNNYAEWIRYRNRISKEEYGTLAKRFDWNKIDPEEWVILAKEAGMKYIIMTTKHHDGVAIWDTKIGDYSLSKLGNTDRDMIKELAEACRKHDMKLGFYYSHWIDWEHPYAWDHNQELTGHVSDQQFNQYWQEKVIPQLTELLTDYGDIALMWFDMWIPYQESIIKKEQLEQVVGLIRKLQPNCLINSRLGLPTDKENVDFQTFGDNQFGTTYVEHPWETPGTIAHSWGYNGQEKNWKSTSQIFESLISNVSLNGGLTLNIGPRADGTVPYESMSRLKEIGNWLGQYGDGLYGTTGLKLRANQHDWGYLTTKTENNKTKVFAQIFNWPLDGILRISGIKSKPTNVNLLARETTKQVKFTQNDALIHIHLPHQQVDHYVSTVVLEYDGPIALDSEIVAESTFGGFALNSNNLHNANESQIIKYDGKNPKHINTSGETLTWDVYFPESGKYAIDVSAHNPNKNDVELILLIGTKSYSAILKPDGKVVVEPNENNYTEEFVNRRITEIEIKTPQKAKIKAKVTNKQSLWINNIWIEKH